MPDIEKKSASELTVDEQIKQVELQTARMNLKLSQQSLIEFEEKEDNKARITKIRVEAMQKEAEEHKRRQNACKHKTGGKGKAGFLSGDARHGYSVIHLVLPTTEAYVMCLRCQREWHHPNWTIKMEIFHTGNTEMTRAQYDKQLAGYAEAMEWGHELTEASEASLFTIPLLQRIDASQVPLAE